MKKIIINLLGSLGYKFLKFPLPLFRGFGPTLIPRPVKLTHYISPMIWPPRLEEITNMEIDKFHQKVSDEMKSLMKKRGRDNYRFVFCVSLYS